MTKIYVASSWRNQDQPHIIDLLREHGHKVYDFRNPMTIVNLVGFKQVAYPELAGKGFHWSEIDPDWQNWDKHHYRKELDHPIAVNGFNLDLDAMKWADVFIGVQPFGRSASIEMGWAAGQNKKTILLLANGEPELMVKIFDHICCNPYEVLEALKS
ncbi:hypothetical protein LCGC14_0777960 [marine sediment metagenome]|uniref:Nucleoside 2-deoxyribosyltransferase n=1 Tax=marine sediment metagenome TaxID=412755 RepID=A0A0F9Q0M0_9ZZZZ|nr:hypothetical protein [Desulfobacterales bacterium]